LKWIHENIDLHGELLVAVCERLGIEVEVKEEMGIDAKIDAAVSRATALLNENGD